MHAIAEFLLKNNIKWSNGTIIALKTSDLMDIKRKLIIKKLQFSEFYEPDIGNTLTAIACVTDCNVFKNLKLL
jgi:hypothetical protein